MTRLSVVWGCSVRSALESELLRFCAGWATATTGTSSNAPQSFAPRYGAIVAWLRSVCARAFEAEVNGAGGGSRGRTSTPLAFVAGSCGERRVGRPD